MAMNERLISELCDDSQHQRCHKKNYACDHPECSRKASAVRFATKRDLERHQHRHNQIKGKRQCPYCEAALDWRPDNFQRHLDTSHNGGITAAISKGDKEAVKMYLSEHPNCIEDTDGWGNSPLWTALTNQQSSMVEFLIQQAVDMATDLPDHWQRNLIFLATRFEMHDMIRALVNTSTDVLKDISDACQFAALEGRRNVLETLLQIQENSGSVTQISTSITLSLLSTGKLDPSWIDTLIRHGADLNHVVDGQTLLMLAVKPHRRYNKDAKVVSRLVECGAKINAKGRNDWTALNMAVSIPPFDYPSYNIVEALLRHGADCQAVTDAGETPLDMAWRIRRNRRDQDAWLKYITRHLEARLVAA